ncbi:hypothetical protein FZC79_08010 [Rossellomorea vietnamensis]|uniref:Intracellular proteinase inhibitor BsuPI domain-containing protein n=1 Tax=Rossellomorea vietnamensis TaxID=218284 RepID=A0A5D4KGU0_9BACI|nr:BsuPI-related putative proteinase inhibitor [Rossellomorea vietnamensis]TYR76089.1 hypothetical protein FZC79_08010 [Rossellomorea vietnamensis]
MIKRFFALMMLLFMISMTAACGMSVEHGEDSGVEEVNNESQNDEEDSKEDSKEDGGQGIVAGEVEPSITKNEKGQFVYTVKNQTEKEVTFEFSSSQRYDYAVKNSSGETIFLYSSAAAFMQVLGSETLAQGEELSYTIELPPGEDFEGAASLEVWLTPKGGKKAPISTSLK